jgi:hypothetical protein
MSSSDRAKWGRPGATERPHGQHQQLVLRPVPSESFPSESFAPSPTEAGRCGGPRLDSDRKDIIPIRVISTRQTSVRRNLKSAPASALQPGATRRLGRSVPLGLAERRAGGFPGGNLNLKGNRDSLGPRSESTGPARPGVARPAVTPSRREDTGGSHSETRLSRVRSVTRNPGGRGRAGKADVP